MPIDNQNIFERISSEYYSLTASEKKVADFALANMSATQYMSISELADACSVAEATVSRFSRRLGYKGYNTFKLAVSKASIQHKPLNPLSGEITENDSMEDMARKLYSAEMEAITQTMELLDGDKIREAAALLEKAKQVFCMGHGGSMLIASEAAHLFSTVSNKFRAQPDSHLQAMAAALMKEGDVVLFFSYSGATRSMMETLKLARQSGAKIILVTRFPNSPGARAADVVLQCGANESPLQTGSVAARIAQMYLLDVLFSEFSRRNMERCRERRTRVADALADKHL